MLKRRPQFINELGLLFSFYSVLSSMSGILCNSDPHESILSSSHPLSPAVSKVSTHHPVRCPQDWKSPNGISIRNISNITIPLTVDIIVNHHVLYSTSTLLKPRTTFSSMNKEVDLMMSNDEAIQYRIVGFNNYIDEMLSITIDPIKVKAAVETSNIDNL